MIMKDFKLDFDLNESSRVFKTMIFYKFELPMASFFLVYLFFFCPKFCYLFHVAMFCMYPKSNFEEKNVGEMFNCPEFH